MRVMKIGGGCLRDGTGLERVVEIVNGIEEPVVVVVSAIHGITDMLSEAIQRAIKSDESIEDTIKELRDKHGEIIRMCINNQQEAVQALNLIDGKLERIERLLYGVAYTEDVFDPVKSMILSYGERMSALLVSHVMAQHGFPARALESQEAGIVTDQPGDNASVLLPQTRANVKRTIRPLLQEGIIPVVTGFYGCTNEGRISTFGRNGTDYSAAVLARVLDAGVLEIWKDVSGFMTADPKIIESAARIDRLSYYEAAELSYFGARILHPRTVEPLADSGIKILVRNICKPSENYTTILPVGKERSDIIKSVTYNPNLAVLRIEGPGVGYKPGIIGDVGQALSSKGINIYSVITSQTRINLLLDPKDSTESIRALEPLVGGVIERVRVDADVTLIAVVGEGLLQTKGLAARVFSAVADENINVEMISAGASDVAYYFIVRKADTHRAILAVHNAFFGN